MGECRLIIGNGDIASALKDIDTSDRLYFVSGVSNSREFRQSEFNRERDLLMAQRWSEHLVYVSSLCVFYSNTLYAHHKREMEGRVKKFSRWTILRVGNITWGNNPNTLINYLHARRLAGQPLEIQDTERYIIDKDEFLYWVKMIPDWSCEMNVTGRRMSIAEIVKEYVEPDAFQQAVSRMTAIQIYP